MSFRAVLFDLDGTLIDSTDAIVDSFLHTFDALNHAAPDRSRIVETISYPLEQQFGMLCELDPIDCARVFRQHYAIVSTAMTTLHPGAREILRWCSDRDLDVGFVTSKRRTASEMLLRYFGVLDHFDVGIGPEDVLRPKPDPEPILKACHLLDIPVDEAVYIGDTHLDMQSARAAGTAQAGVTTGYASRETLEAEKPHVIVDSLDEICEWLESRV